MSVETKQFPVEVFHEVWPCPEEGCDGEMRACSGMTLTSDPPQYPHECETCGRTGYASGVNYPRTVYRRVEPTDA